MPTSALTNTSEKKLSEGARDFIDEDRLLSLLRLPKPGIREVESILAKSLSKQPLTVEETARLLLTDDPEALEAIFETARVLKRIVYGNRIVLFAPLYIGNKCVNDCRYCGFRRSNKGVERITLSPVEIREQVEALERKGHKRLILVFGEHPDYGPDFMARTVRTVYSTKTGKGEIRRVNINAAPLDIDGYRTMKKAGIGTYQIFQETYHHATYKRYHPPGTMKGDYLWRLDGLDRAMLGDCDDVGLGALFGLFDWRFDVLGLVTHALHLKERFGVGCHTISFPRLRPAYGVKLDEKYLVSDEDFKRLVAILRLAVPYTGMILTAREPAGVRREVMAFGVSQIDAGSRIDFRGYTKDDEQELDREQFALGDTRSLDEVIRELIEGGDIPSFCTACYRLGRTGEHFMEYAIPGFINRFCTPNAISTLTEYITDYASDETKKAGEKLIEKELNGIKDSRLKLELAGRLVRIVDKGERDLFF